MSDAIAVHELRVWDGDGDPPDGVCGAGLVVLGHYDDHAEVIAYNEYAEQVADEGGVPLSYEDWLEDTA